MLRRLIKTIIFILLFVVFVGCSTIQMNYVNPAGRQLPDHCILLNGVGEPISTIFYYSTFKLIKDVDGTLIKKTLEYLPMTKIHHIYTNKVDGLTLTIEVNNPTGIEYSLYQQMSVKTRTGDIQTGGEINRSNLSYRQFVYMLPYSSDVRRVDHFLTLQVKGQPVLRIGHFEYQLTTSKVDQRR